MSLFSKIMLAGMHTHVTVLLSGGTYATETNVNPTTASFKFDTDGKVYTRQNADGFVQVSPLTDWIRPASEAPSDYQIRFTSLTGDTGSFTATTATEDAWQALSTQVVFTVDDTTALQTNEKSCTFTVEIRKGTGPTITSASYTLTTNYDSAA